MVSTMWQNNRGVMDAPRDLGCSWKNCVRQDDSQIWNRSRDQDTKAPLPGVPRSVYYIKQHKSSIIALLSYAHNISLNKIKV